MDIAIILSLGAVFLSLVAIGIGLSAHSKIG